MGSRAGTQKESRKTRTLRHQCQRRRQHCAASRQGNCSAEVLLIVDDRLACGLRVGSALYKYRIVWSTNKPVRWQVKGLKPRCPVGRRRLEPLGILVFSITIIISFFEILQGSVVKLYTGMKGTPQEAANLPPVAIRDCYSEGSHLVSAAFPSKLHRCKALAQDCKTDVVFNTLSLLFPLVGHSAHIWWLDPLGAAVLLLSILYDWAETRFGNVTRLCGSTVDDLLQKKLIFLAYPFTPLVERFKSITAYHAGTASG
jgi:hypothetical protein